MPLASKNRVLLPRWIFMLVLLSGCATIPKGFLKLPENYLEKRQIQMRKYESLDQAKVISAVAGVLQDLGFTLEDSETKIGFIAASKEADASNAAQVVGAALLDFLSALSGNYTNYTYQIDAVQHIKASVIVKPSLSDKSTIVRVTFQRIVRNMNNQINRVETIQDPEVYQRFFEALSKSLFLEGQGL